MARPIAKNRHDRGSRAFASNRSFQKLPAPFSEPAPEARALNRHQRPLTRPAYCWIASFLGSLKLSQLPAWYNKSARTSPRTRRPLELDVTLWVSFVYLGHQAADQH